MGRRRVSTGRPAGWPARILGSSMLLWGVAGVGGGIGLAGSPDGASMRFDTAWLARTPFRDWFVPGCLLGGVGVTSLAAAGLVARDERYDSTPPRWHWGVVAGASVIQVGWMAGEVAFLIEPVSHTDRTTRRFFQAFWSLYAPWAIANAALAFAPSVRHRRTKA